MTRSSRSSSSASHRTALAFDFGLRSIGVATGQTRTGTATPLTHLRARDGVPDWDAVARLLETWKPDVVVVGLPLDMDGSESEMCRRAQRFGRRIKGRFGHTVEFQDERLSSREAWDRLPMDSKRSDTHGVAAQVILEDWLTAELDRRTAEPRTLD